MREAYVFLKENEKKKNTLEAASGYEMENPSEGVSLVEGELPLIQKLNDRVGSG